VAHDRAQGLAFVGTVVLLSSENYQLPCRGSRTRYSTLFNKDDDDDDIEEEVEVTRRIGQCMGSTFELWLPNASTKNSHFCGLQKGNFKEKLKAR
jgi:hypothetical protein